MSTITKLLKSRSLFIRNIGNVNEESKSANMLDMHTIIYYDCKT